MDIIYFMYEMVIEMEKHSDLKTYYSVDSIEKVYALNVIYQYNMELKKQCYNNNNNTIIIVPCNSNMYPCLVSFKESVNFFKQYNHIQKEQDYITLLEKTVRTQYTSWFQKDVNGLKEIDLLELKYCNVHGKYTRTLVNSWKKSISFNFCDYSLFRFYNLVYDYNLNEQLITLLNNFSKKSEFIKQNLIILLTIVRITNFVLDNITIITGHIKNILQIENFPEEIVSFEYIINTEWAFRDCYKISMNTYNFLDFIESHINIDTNTINLVPYGIYISLDSKWIKDDLLFYAKGK